MPRAQPAEVRSLRSLRGGGYAAALASGKPGSEANARDRETKRGALTITATSAKFTCLYTN
jgi:hypothetical protein